MKFLFIILKDEKIIFSREFDYDHNEKIISNEVENFGGVSIPYSLFRKLQKEISKKDKHCPVFQKYDNINLLKFKKILYFFNFNRNLTTHYFYHLIIYGNKKEAEHDIKLLIKHWKKSKNKSMFLINHFEIEITEFAEILI